MAGTDWAAVLAGVDGYSVRPGVSAEDLRVLAAELRVELPAELAWLYRFSDGIFDEPGQWFVVWPVADVIARNKDAWALETSARRGLVAFGDDGTGTPFCVRRDGGDEVVVWSAIDDAGVVVAGSVGAFWSGWIRGSLKY